MRKPNNEDLCFWSE